MAKPEWKRYNLSFEGEALSANTPVWDKTWLVDHLPDGWFLQVETDNLVIIEWNPGGKNAGFLNQWIILVREVS